VGGSSSQRTSQGAALTPVAPVLPDESVQAMAAVSGSGSGGPGSVVAETSSSGFTINLIFDAAAMANTPAAAAFRGGIEQAASILSATITNKITVNINIDYSGTGGGAAAGPDNGQFLNYSTVRSDLISDAVPGDPTFNSLPNTSSIQGQSQVAVWNAQLKLFGLLSPNDTTTDDGSATFATDISPNLLVGVALHELTHALGRVPYGPQPDVFDLFRYTSSSIGTSSPTLLFSNKIPTTAASFSLDGGKTKLADFGLYSDPSDFLNPPNGALAGPYSNLTPNDPFNEIYTSSTLQSLTTVDKQMLDALGFNTITQGISVATTTSEAIQGGAALTLLSGAPTIADGASTTLSSAFVKIANSGGNAVAGDQLFVNGVQNGSVGNGVSASWNGSTGTLTLTGSASIAIYDTLLSEISYQDTGTDTSSGSHPVRAVTWTVSDGTNSFSTTSQITIDRSPVAHSDAATDTVGSTVSVTAATGVLSNDSDLDGDKLTVTGISDAANGVGTLGKSLAGVYGHLTLSADGSYTYVADNSAAINGAPSGSHPQDTFTYTVSDGNGGTTTAPLTVTLDRAPVVTSSNVTLSAGQTSVAASSLFAAIDPDGNAIATYAFKDTGGGHFVLNGVVESNNQEIDVTVAQLPQLAYEAAAGAAPDTLQVRVTDGTLWSNWTSFTVTAPPIVIQTDGSTALTEVGNQFFLDNTGSGIGPELKYGTPVTVGEFGNIAPIGAIQTATGYDVAWQIPGTSEFTFWTVDNNGNYLSNPTGLVPGNSLAVESFETTFGQDFNGDGVIGVPASLIQTDGSTSLYKIATNYYIYVGGSGPELKYGAPVTVGEFGNITPIGAIQTATGYDVAWQIPGTSQFTFWTIDNNGNYLSNPTGLVSGNSFAVESLELTFGQDINGDGTIGFGASLIRTDGSTSLLESANNYYIYVAGSGCELKYGGAPVTVGEFGNIAPIGAIQTATGYDVAWQIPGTSEFTFWTVDNNGNYNSNIAGGLIAGIDSTLKSFESIFYQDFNGDGYIGSSTTIINVSDHVVLPLTSVAQPVAIGAGATIELTGSDSSSVTFEGSTGTLVLDHSALFSGKILNLMGNGSLSGSDQLDLRDITFGAATTESFIGNSSSGTLTIHDAQNHTANLLLVGNYTNSTFTLSSDGNGGTIIVDPPMVHFASESFMFSDSALESSVGINESRWGTEIGFNGDHHSSNFYRDAALSSSATGTDIFRDHSGDPSGAFHQVNLHDHHFIIV
jgi:VCBS repeat-containing protein